MCNAKRLVTAREVTNAVNQYAITIFAKANVKVSLGEANAKPIRWQGIAVDGSCVALDVLVPDSLIA